MPLSEQAYQRRFKRQIAKKEHEFFVVCALGFEELLASELRALGHEVKVETGGVSFWAQFDAMYEVHLQVRSAHRVLLRIASGLAQNLPMLYEKLGKVALELYLKNQEHYALNVSTKASKLTMKQRLQSCFDDALAKRFRAVGEVKPSLDKQATIQLNLRLYQDSFQLAINLSGEHLHKRGYRHQVGPAPIRETSAAAILQLVGAENYAYIIDPMCGSGTFAIELALMLSRTPLARFRGFAFEGLAFHKKGMWERLKEGAEARTLVPSQKILAADFHVGAVEAARGNICGAQLEHLIQVQQQDFFTWNLSDIRRDVGDACLIVLNPPYGARLGLNEAKRFYQRIIQHIPSGVDVAILCPQRAWIAPLFAELYWSKPIANTSQRVYLVKGRR